MDTKASPASSTGRAEGCSLVCKYRVEAASTAFHTDKDKVSGVPRGAMVKVFFIAYPLRRNFLIRLPPGMLSNSSAENSSVIMAMSA